MDSLGADANAVGHRRDGSSYGRSLVVAFGWYATVVAALVVAAFSLPEAPRRDCGVIFGCLSPVEKLTLIGTVVGIPIAIGLSVLTLIVAAPIARRIPSAVLAGTLSAFASVAVAAVLVAAYLAA